MITNERLAEIETAPREAGIFKAEAAELVAAYKARIAGLTVTTDDNGAWLHIKSPSGKIASLNVESLGESRRGLIGNALLEWSDALAGRINKGETE